MVWNSFYLNNGGSDSFSYGLDEAAFILCIKRRFWMVCFLILSLSARMA
jgi:hypothetical protein